MDICDHLEHAGDPPPRTKGCEECLRIGSRWVHLRRCLVCGHVGCCDNSPNRHARGHFEGTGHATIQSAQPGEAWRYCFVDDLLVDEGEVVETSRM